MLDTKLIRKQHASMGNDLAICFIYSWSQPESSSDKISNISLFKLMTQKKIMLG